MRFAGRRDFTKKTAPGEERGREQHQPWHEAGKNRRRRGEENERAEPTADEADDEQSSHRQPGRARRVRPTGEAGDELRGKQRNGRGDVGRTCVHTGQHQRRKGDECAAASERILHPRPHRGDEEDNEGGHRDIRSGVPAEGGRTFYSRGGRKGKLSPSAIAHVADRVIKQTINGAYNNGRICGGEGGGSGEGS